ncbi:MAG: phosphonate ABC transporter permease, partial [Ruminococcus sp.]|nr:phosphonate ABC transporter permease [Ruminococcus sp.]
MKINKNKGYFGLKYLLMAYLLVSVVLPIVYLFSSIRGNNISDVFSSTQFIPMLKNSVVTTVIATAISITLSFALAWLLNRSNIKFKSIFV